MDHALQPLESRRLLSAGDLDPTFFGDGTGTVQFGQRSVDTVYASVVQPDGKVIIVGSTFADDGNGTDLAVARLNPDATLDQSFGVTIDGGVGGGLFELPLPTNTDNFFSVALDGFGRVVVAGSVANFDGFGILEIGQAVVIRLLPDGTPDESFGTGVENGGTGFVLVPLSINPNTGAPNSEARAVGIQSTGKILIGGTAEADSATGSSSFAVARLNDNGALDPTFGESGTGIEVEGVPGLVTAILGLDILTDDRIVFTGTAVVPTDGVNPTTGYFVTARTTPDGLTDFSFGDEGSVITQFDGTGFTDVVGVAQTVVALPDGKTLVGGLVERSTTASSRIALVRYNADGSLDATFGTPDENGQRIGILETFLPEGSGETNLSANQIRVRADGTFFVSGRAGHAGSESFNGSVVVRYLSNGDLDRTFSGDGVIVLFPDDTFTTSAVVNDVGDAAKGAGAFVEEIPGGGVLILASGAGGTLTAARLVADGPDLVTSVTVLKPGSFLGGAKGSASVKVSNQGSAAFVGTVPVRLLLSTDGALSADDIAITTTAQKVKLLAGQSGKAATVKFNYPKGASVSGQYFVLVAANEGRGILEGNFLNNAAFGVTPVQVRPAFIDLGATLVGAPLTAVTAGKKAAFSVQLVNGGNIPAKGNVTLQLFASADAVFGDDRLLAGAKPLKLSLKPGAKTQKLSGVIPVDLAPGVYTVLLRLDSTSLNGVNPVRDTVTAMTLSVV